MEPRFFKTPAAFRAWLEKHHATAAVLLVGFYKRDSGKPSITWPESVDQALCFGWIDGVRRRIDDASYSIRFTPRRPRSNWSDINIRRITELEKMGLVREAGRAAFEQSGKGTKRDYSYEIDRHAPMTKAHEKTFRADAKAWAFFQAQPPGYRRLLTFYVQSAKKEETRIKRLLRLIAASRAGRRVGAALSEPGAPT